jgi:hypothetical protein
MDELQSDWHQDGSAYGYISGDPNDPANEQDQDPRVKKEMEKVQNTFTEMFESARANILGKAQREGGMVDMLLKKYISASDSEIKTMLAQIEQGTDEGERILQFVEEPVP